MTFDGGVFEITRRVLSLSRDHRWRIAGIVALGLVAALFEGVGLSLVIPITQIALAGGGASGSDFFGGLIGRIFGADVSTIPLMLAAAGIFLAGLVTGVVNLLLSTKLSLDFAEELRGQIFEGVLRREVAELEGMSSGRLMNVLATESWRACDALFVVISLAVQSIAITVLSLFLLTISPFHTMLLAGLTAAMAAVVFHLTRRMRRIGARATAANAALTSYVFNALNGLRVVRGFGRERYERRRFARRSAQVSAVFLRLTVLSGIVGPLSQLMAAGIVVILVLISILRGDDAAVVIGFLAIAYRLQLRVASFLGERTGLLGFEAPVNEVRATITGVGAPDTGGRAFASLARGIRFEEVAVRYPRAEVRAVRDLSFDLKAGEVTAIAGRSGAGKSTLVALLLRFVTPEHGRVVVDGVPLDEISPEDWHARIAFVEQNAFLFAGSVRANIGYGRLGAGFEEIRAAARAAQADEFVMALEDGYDTRIGERGARLSQGQRQRIALARALLRDPDILILDEATNALDLVTERALRDVLAQRDRTRIVIVIAHRRETIEVADRVLVLQDGELVQDGSPRDLARMPGPYEQLYRNET